MAKKSTTASTETAPGTPAAPKAAAKPRARKASAPAAAQEVAAPAATPMTAIVPAAPVAVASAPRRYPTHEQISTRAFQIWVASGRVAGRDVQNWKQAEAELISELNR